MPLCPYCKIRPKLKGRHTCGTPECQHKRKLARGRKYFDEFLRKTERRVSVSITRIERQSAELAAR